ncbi:MAG TPA: hypothetical protein VN721_16625 [Flavipsychrobacter sp.]|nr:hypothetical protein [Flavipsychrobacter sp.]
MHDVQIWVLSGIVCISGIIIGFFSKTGFNLVVQLLSEIKDEIKKLTTETTKHEQKILSMKEKLEDHESRLRLIEKQNNNYQLSVTDENII